MTGWKRTILAAAIVVAGLAGPCAAWFVTGSRAARNEAARLREAPITTARMTSERVAQTLGLRLEALRQSESRRSFLDYTDSDRADVAGASCGTVHSPLAEGPADPLVWAHFQIDDVGQMSLPTLAGGADRAEASLAIERAILDLLECSTPVDAVAKPADPEPVRRQAVRSARGEWTVDVGPIGWHTFDLDGNAALLALRDVTTPNAILRQGFVVRRSDLEALIDQAAGPVHLRPGAPEQPWEAAILLQGDAWAVANDVTRPRAAAESAARQVESDFRRTFTIGLLAALVGGGLVTGLVWQAERLGRQRARFAASAAHELRTPLAGLRMYGEMLADGSGDPSRSARYAGRIAGEAERLGRVVSNLLGFSRLERGRLTLHCEAGDLAEAVRRSVEQLRPTLEMDEARVEIVLDADLPAVRFDRDALHQILQNLLDNAEKFGREASDRTIRVVLERRGDGVSLAVIDRGPGVAPELRRRLFEPFARSQSSDAPPGLGLGLALVHALARAQGAVARFEDPVQGGSCFRVDFPAARAQTGVAPPTRARPSPAETT